MPHRRPPLWIFFALPVLALLSAGLLIGWRAAHVLHQAEQEVRSGQEIRFTQHPFVAPASVNFELVSSPDVFVQAVTFQQNLYIAGPAGLSEYDSGGNLLRQFLAGRELPSSPLVTLAVARIGDSAEPQLILATASEGLLLFDDKNFQQIYPENPDLRAITAILPASSGHLLIGTKKRGVVLFDGQQFRELHSTLDHLYVQALAGSELDLWVGTLNRGVAHWHAGATETFAEADGLPDPQVQALALAGDKTYVGTPLGVAEFVGGRFSRVLGEGLLITALLPSDDDLLAGTEDQGVIRIPLRARRIAGRAIQAQASSQFGGLPNSEQQAVQQFLPADDGAYVLTRNALYKFPAHSFAWKKVLQPRPAVLTDSNISALAADRSGQLWVGYFDRGLDILRTDAQRVVHVEDQHVFCINRIWPDAKTSTIAVATANGLVRMGATGNVQQVLTRTDGLIADHVTDVAAYQQGLAIATPAGLTFLDASGARSMYAFHGLVNNHVYALAVSGDDLLVGTLGGLSAIAKGYVLANYTAGAGGLQQNWITAVVPVGDEWMVGTYGGGVLSLDRHGHFHTFELATADININPNAMLVTGKYVFAGTLGHGLYVFDRSQQRWSALSAGLPSQNVTALAAGNGFIYVGTDNGLVRIPERKLQP